AGRVLRPTRRASVRSNRYGVVPRLTEHERSAGALRPPWRCGKGQSDRAEEDGAPQPAAGTCETSASVANSEHGATPEEEIVRAQSTRRAGVSAARSFWSTTTYETTPAPRVARV